MLTGAVKLDRDPIGTKVHWDHLDMLRRAADAGRRWGHRALEPDSLLLYMAGGGFAPRLRAAAEARGHHVVCWRLEDLYAVGAAVHLSFPPRRHKVATPNSQRCSFSPSSQCWRHRARKRLQLQGMHNLLSWHVSDHNRREDPRGKYRRYLLPGGSPQRFDFLAEPICRGRGGNIAQRGR